MFLIYLLGVALFFAFLANFAFRKIFKSLSWVDKPDGVKKLHKNNIPLSGGISFITSLIFAVLIFDFFAGVNFNLSWNGFFVGDSIKEDNSLNKNIDNSNVRVSILGHIQRGGIPSPSDRILASTLGYESINAITSGLTNKMVGIINQEPTLIDLNSAISTKKKVNLSLSKISDIISKY